MLVDGQLYAMGDADSYLHDDLEYHSEHCYQIRSRNKEGYSEWSSEIRTMTLADPWRNEIGAAGKVTFAEAMKQDRSNMQRITASAAVFLGRGRGRTEDSIYL